MKTAQILSFDLVRPGEASVSLAIASLMAYLSTQPGYGTRFQVENESFNLLALENDLIQEAIEAYLQRTDFRCLDTLAISAYVWNENWLPGLLRQVRQRGFEGKLVLGGYQISYGEPRLLEETYPEADIFLSGYAEKSFYEAILMPRPPKSVHLNQALDFDQVPSPYLTGMLPVAPGQDMVRLETKRGCPYRCNFCAHRDLVSKQVFHYPAHKTRQELTYLHEKQVRKINVLDPIFNMGTDYLGSLQTMEELGLEALVTLQTRFELIRGASGERFLDYAERLPLHLEFGLQTIIEAEYRAIKRPNQPDMIRRLMQQLNERNISYELSLIYGLPGQTLDSFRRSIDFVRENGGQQLKAFPLMLLRGTELYAQQEQWGMQERKLGAYDIPTVVASHSFTEKEWEQMHALAQDLMPACRV